MPDVTFHHIYDLKVSLSI